MKITIEEITPERLGEYANIPIAFMVRSIYQVELVDNGLGGMSMIEVPVERPYIKDYDLEESPEDWPRKFDVANWGFFLAKADQRFVGAAAVAFDTTGVFMLEARRDLAVLWDIRVCPEYRGVGIPLFRQAEK